MHIRKLRRTDVPAAMALSTGAGWNQVAADWRRLLALAPDGYWGGHVDGGLVATATALAYGRDLAWIGMVLVRPDHRRRGHERALFEHALRREHLGSVSALDRRACGLDRTALLTHLLRETDVAAAARRIQPKQETLLPPDV